MILIIIKNNIYFPIMQVAMNNIGSDCNLCQNLPKIEKS